jgi:hypothetical protein
VAGFFYAGAAGKDASPRGMNSLFSPLKNHPCVIIPNLPGMVNSKCRSGERIHGLTLNGWIFYGNGSLSQNICGGSRIFLTRPANEPILKHPPKGLGYRTARRQNEVFKNSLCLAVRCAAYAADVFGAKPEWTISGSGRRIVRHRRANSGLSVY